MHRAYSYPLKLTVRQSTGLALLMRLQCELYNAALEERRMTYKWLKVGISAAKVPSKIDQFKTLTGLSDLRPELKPFGITVCGGTLTRLDEAFAGFFRRLNAGQRPGFPRFKAASRFDSVSWSDSSGWKLDEENRRLYIQGIGDVKLNLHRPLKGEPKTLTIRRRGRRVEATVFCAKVPANELPKTHRSIGIDLGVGVLAATTSEGELHENPRHRRRLAPALERAQQERSRRRRGSSRYRRATADIARLKHKEASRRKDALHKLSRRLVDENDVIVHERLKIDNMSRSARGTIQAPGHNVAAKSGLNNAILDSGWARLISMVSYKALEDAGRTVIAVNPRHTSQRCSSCDHVAAKNRHKQKFSCLRCGFTDHADLNAARNILRAGLAHGGSEGHLANAERVSR
jgi:putative transposase